MKGEKEYHRSRRMFFVIDDNLVIAEANSEKSHFEWLLEQYWPEEKATEFIETGLRGALNPDGNIRFYIRESCEINEEIEKKFFDILPELVEKLNISLDAKVGGGVIKGEIGKLWPPRKEYGKVKDLIYKKWL